MPTQITTKEMWLNAMTKPALTILYNDGKNKVWTRDPEDTETYQVTWSIVVYDNAMRHMGEILAETIAKKSPALKYAFGDRTLWVIAKDEDFAQEIYNLTVLALEVNSLDKPKNPGQDN